MPAGHASDCALHNGPTFWPGPTFAVVVTESHTMARCRSAHFQDHEQIRNYSSWASPGERLRAVIFLLLVSTSWR
jgi:hypothetical protein